MRWLASVVCAVTALCVGASSVSAVTAPLVNGDFETGDLTGWETFVLPNGDVSPGFPFVEPFDVTGDGNASNAVKYRVGQIDFIPDDSSGGGIRQTIDVTHAGLYRLSADIASFNDQIVNNNGPGRYDLLVDDQIVASVNLDGTPITPGETIRDHLEGTIELDVGQHTIEYHARRRAVNSRLIFMYMDNLAFTKLGSLEMFMTEPVFDVEGEPFGPSFLLTDGPFRIVVQKSDFSQIDRRASMEFDISAIPDDADVQSVSILFDVNLLSGQTGSFGTIDLFGYAGNGVANTTDPGQTANLIGQNVDASTGLHEITLDAGFVESLLGSTDFLGITMVGDGSEGDQFGFHTLESAFGDAPKLKVNYVVVPEPGTVGLMVIAGVALLARRR